MSQPDIAVIEQGKPYPGIGADSFPMAGAKALLVSPVASVHMLFCFDNLTRREVRGFDHGKVRLGLYRQSARTTFLLYELAEFCDWGDATLQLAFNGAGARFWPATEPGFGRLLMLNLLDWPSRRVVTMRGVSVSPDFADALDGLMREQEKVVPFTTAAQLASDLTMGRMLLPHEMVAKALIVEEAGTDATFRSAKRGERV